jgi:hypothetical protein
MPTLHQMNPRLAGRIKELFPVTQEHWDLITAFQECGKHDVEFSVEQIQRTLAGIHEDAIPRTQQYFATQAAPEQKQEARRMLEDWETLEHIFAGAL